MYISSFKRKKTGADSPEITLPVKKTPLSTSIKVEAKFMGRNALKCVKYCASQTKKMCSDVMGTNIFDLYDCSNCKPAKHPIFDSKGWKSIRFFFILFTLFCPAYIFMNPTLYAAAGGVLLMDASATGKAKPKDKVKPSARQKRLAKERQEAEKLRKEKEETAQKVLTEARTRREKYLERKLSTIPEPRNFEPVSGV